MKKNSINQNAGRREFLNAIAVGTAAFGWTSVASLRNAQAASAIPSQDASGLEAWFNTIKGKHRILFDAVTTNEGYSVIWPYTFMNTNNQTGTPDNELSVVVILRSKAIPLALNDKMWAKYKLGKMFKIIDYAANSPSERNLYLNPKAGEMPEDGMSISELLARGVMFCVCETAIGMTTRQYAKSKGIDPIEVKNDWIAGLIPGIRLVPSGVWALDRVQEHGCSYCSTG